MQSRLIWKGSKYSQADKKVWKSLSSYMSLNLKNIKVSLRSKQYIDVSVIAKHFGGGGHIRAAGVTMTGSAHDVINNITEQIARQFEKLEEKSVIPQ